MTELAYCKVIFQHIPQGTEGHHDKGVQDGCGPGQGNESVCVRVCVQIIQLPCVAAYSFLAVYETLVTKVQWQHTMC
jgi:hypothetical protein